MDKVSNQEPHVPRRGGLIETLEEIDIEVFDLFEDGSCYVEKKKDSLLLCTEEHEIDLNREFAIQGKSVVQGTVTIDLKEEYILSHLTQIKECTNANRNSQT